MSLDARAKIIVEAVASNAISQFQKTGQAIGGVSDAAKKQSGILDKSRAAWQGMLVGIAATTAAIYTAKKAFDFAKEGAAIQRLEQAGETLAASFGQDMGAIVKAIQTASNGTISKMDAMAAANKALLLGVAKTPEEFGRLTASALALGQAMGRGPNEAINDITVGIGRMSPLILDNLGILTRGGKVYDDYAKTLGTTADKLTDTQKKQALLNATMTSAAPLLDKAGNLISDNASSYEALSASIADAKAEVQKFASVALIQSGIIEGVTDAISLDTRAWLELSRVRDLSSMGWTEAYLAFRRIRDMLEELPEHAEQTRRAIGSVATVIREVDERSSMDRVREHLREVAEAAGIAYDPIKAMADTLAWLSGKQFETSIAVTMTMNQLGAGPTWLPRVGRVTLPQGGLLAGTGVRGAASVQAGAFAQAQAMASLTDRQHGGPLGRGVSLVGEQGPELVINDVVIPTSITRQLLKLGLVPGGRFGTGGTIGDPQGTNVGGFGGGSTTGGGSAATGGGGGGGSVTGGASAATGSGPGGSGGGGGNVAVQQAVIVAAQAAVAEIAPAVTSAVLASQAAGQQAAAEIRLASERTIASNARLESVLLDLLEVTERQGDAAAVGRAIRDATQQVEG